MLVGFGGILVGDRLVLVVAVASKCSGGFHLGSLHGCWVWEAAGVVYQH